MIFNPMPFKLALQEPQRNWLFSVYIEGIELGFPHLLYRIRKVSFPYISVNFESKSKGKRIYHLPQSPTLGDITVDFIEGVDGACELFYMGWIQKIWNADGTRNNPSNYYKTVTISKYSMTGFPTGQVWQFRRVMPSSLSPSSYDMDGNGIIIRTLTMKPEAVVVFPTIQDLFNRTKAVQGKLAQNLSDPTTWQGKITSMKMSETERNALAEAQALMQDT